MTILILFSFVAFLTVEHPVWAIGSESVFKKHLLSKPNIVNPNDPFVLVFMDGGCDRCPYGFVTSGSMDVDDWKGVFAHVGHLTAYGVFKPDDARRWSADGRDLAVSAAQSIGRFTGGSIMGVPSTKSALENVNTAFEEELGLKITHFFHDDEQFMGTPGGKGNWRVKLAAGQDGVLEAGPSSDFNTAKGEKLESFQLSFGLFIGEYIFGGSAKLMGSFQTESLGGLKNGWSVNLVNTGGFHGQNRIVFSTSTGETVSSVPFNNFIGQTWLPITISLNSTKNEAVVEVVIEITDVGKSVGRVKRPIYGGAGFTIGAPSGLAHDISLDDIQISSLSGKTKELIAEYDFEEAKDTPFLSELAVSKILDRSERRHDLLVNVTRQASIQYVSTNGIDLAVAKQLKSGLLDNLLQTRSLHNLPSPYLITNWRVADVPGRSTAWKSHGFTHGSAVYYLSGVPKEQDSKIAHILLNRVPMSMRAQTDATSWGHAWLGNVNPAKAALTPNEFSSLVVMTVLEGYRWFSVFTAMSKGHLAPDDYPYQDKAKTNADAIYAIAQAASWFQGSSNTLRSSVYSEPAGLTIPSNVIFRSRVNPLTKEMWFAACSGNRALAYSFHPIPVPLTNLSGTVTDLATGEISHVKEGVFKLYLNQAIHPFHFKPKQ